MTLKIIIEFSEETGYWTAWTTFKGKTYQERHTEYVTAIGRLIWNYRDVLPISVNQTGTGER